MTDKTKDAEQQNGIELPKEGKDDRVELATVASKQVRSVIAGGKDQETHNGLPLLNVLDYNRLYNTDVRVGGEDTSATFNFQGYTRETRPEMLYQGTFYKDAMATNGLLKSKSHEGIHVGTDGTNFGNSHTMRSPEDVNEYHIYLTVPGQLQREMNCVCSEDSCFSIEDYKNNSYRDNEDIEIAHNSQKPGWIVIELSLDPTEDPLAREKVQFIHQVIVRHIEDKRPLEEIESMVYNLQDELMDISEDDFRDKSKELGQAPESLTE